MSGTLQQMVAQHRLNLAITYNPTSQRNLKCLPLLEEPLYLIGPSNSPFANRSEITVDEVLKLPLVLPEEKHGLRMKIEREADQRGITLNLALEVSAWPLLTDTARRGLGYTILPSAAVHEMVARKEVIAIPITSEMTRTLALVTPVDLPASVATGKLADLIMQQVAQHVRDGLWKGRLLFDADKLV